MKIIIVSTRADNFSTSRSLFVINSDRVRSKTLVSQSERQISCGSMPLSAEIAVTYQHLESSPYQRSVLFPHSCLVIRDFSFYPWFHPGSHIAFRFGWTRVRAHLSVWGMYETPTEHASSLVSYICNARCAFITIATFCCVLNLHWITSHFLKSCNAHQ